MQYARIISMLAALSAGACAHDPRETHAQGAIWRDLRLTVSGTLHHTDSCPVLVDAGGRRYGLVGDVTEYRSGEHLEVSGPVARWAQCATYSTLRADRVRTIGR